ncbi:MAG TPA: spore germination protein GerW family protein [Gaiellaceae bacterium]|nr:spore germination protein GerW family protein [Gaiellaceae bacterium]
MATEMRNGTALAEELVQRIGQTVGDGAKVTAVFGEPVEREGITVIPVAKARFGFGGGGGGGTRDGEEGSGGGGGGGAFVSPVGYIEVTQGTARFKRISKPADVLTLVAAAALTALAIRGLLSG